MRSQARVKLILKASREEIPARPRRRAKAAARHLQNQRLPPSHNQVRSPKRAQKHQVKARPPANSLGHKESRPKTNPARRGRKFWAPGRSSGSNGCSVKFATLKKGWNASTGLQIQNSAVPAL